jgi:hypothetical protein
MRYQDKATIKQVTTHQNKIESNFFGHMTNRQRERIRERQLKEFRNKIPDKIWWDSLTTSDKNDVLFYYDVKVGSNNLDQLMIAYPGSIEYIRETKINSLLNKKDNF